MDGGEGRKSKDEPEHGGLWEWGVGGGALGVRNPKQNWEAPCLFHMPLTHFCLLEFCLQVFNFKLESCCENLLLQPTFTSLCNYLQGETPTVSVTDVMMRNGEGGGAPAD